MPFSVYVPRECQDPNTSDLVIRRNRMDVSIAKQNFPDYADQFKGEREDEQNTESLAAYFEASLRCLQYTADIEEESEKINLIEAWLDWNALGSDVQDAIEKEWAELPSSIYPIMTKLTAASQFGLFCFIYKDCIVQWSENPWDGK